MLLKGSWIRDLADVFSCFRPLCDESTRLMGVEVGTQVCVGVGSAPGWATPSAQRSPRAWLGPPHRPAVLPCRQLLPSPRVPALVTEKYGTT